MIVALLVIIIGMAWLLKETDYLRVRLLVGKIPDKYEPSKHFTKLDNTLQFKTMAYPKPKPILQLEEYCYVTKLEHELTARYFRSFATGKESYQAMNIGGHTITVNSHNPKLYKVIAEAEKIADSKIKPKDSTCSKLNQQKMFWTSRYNPETGNDDIRKSNCLFPIEWLEAHYQDVIPEPTIEISVNGKDIHFNGNFKTGMIHDFCVVNAEVWERPRIKGKKQRASEITA